jgi:hypothetical protein
MIIIVIGMLLGNPSILPSTADGLNVSGGGCLKMGGEAGLCAREVKQATHSSHLRLAIFFAPFTPCHHSMLTFCPAMALPPHRQKTSTDN